MCSNHLSFTSLCVNALITENHSTGQYECHSSEGPSFVHRHQFQAVLQYFTCLTVPASGKQPANMCISLFCIFSSKQVLTLWGYGDVLALVKEILIQTACLKLNEHLVHAPHPLKVCVECSWLSFKKILLIGIKCG